MNKLFYKIPLTNLEVEITLKALELYEYANESNGPKPQLIANVRKLIIHDVASQDLQDEIPVGEVEEVRPDLIYKPSTKSVVEKLQEELTAANELVLKYHKDNRRANSYIQDLEVKVGRLQDEKFILEVRLDKIKDALQ